jgi:alpha-ketoglutarate-dependent taurine dioxygenase
VPSPSGRYSPYKVVFFRDQDLDRDQHVAFARQFGPLYTHPSVNKPCADKVPAIPQIAAADAKKYEKLAELQKAEGWDPYHSDISWRLVPTWGAVLRAVTLPEVGGDTIWVDAGLAYDGLPDDVHGSGDSHPRMPTRPAKASGRRLGAAYARQLTGRSDDDGPR